MIAIHSRPFLWTEIMDKEFHSRIMDQLLKADLRLNQPAQQPQHVEHDVQSVLSQIQEERSWQQQSK